MFLQFAAKHCHCHLVRSHIYVYISLSHTYRCARLYYIQRHCCFKYLCTLYIAGASHWNNLYIFIFSLSIKKSDVTLMKHNLSQCLCRSVGIFVINTPVKEMIQSNWCELLGAGPQCTLFTKMVRCLLWRCLLWCAWSLLWCSRHHNALVYS